jgi:hypothetical protein
MELRDATDKANQILDEERSSPTVQYSLRVEAIKLDAPFARELGMLAVVAEPRTLQIIRSQRPRQIVEDPRKWEFKSVNYDLLCALLSQVPEDSRATFLAAVLARLNSRPGCSKSKKSIDPTWNGWVSEFPLVAEFCVRNGAKDLFLQALAGINLDVGHAVLLRHIEDMIALNFNLFADSDYRALTKVIISIGYTARKQFKLHWDKGVPGNEGIIFYREVVEGTEGIREECRKAQFLYLKGALLEGLNLEVNQDKAVVESFLKTQGFSEALVECLNYVDRIYQSASSGFEFKTCMDHLRSFMETLHSEGLAKFQIGAVVPTGQKWGEVLKHLRQRGLLSKAEEGYVSALFTLLSDEGVHPIIAEKEYARLARNVVIEYALLFLRKLDKLEHPM